MQSTLDYITLDTAFQIVVIAVILSIDCLIFFTIMLLASKFESPEKAKESNLIA